MLAPIPHRTAEALTSGAVPAGGTARHARTVDAVIVVGVFLYNLPMAIIFAPGAGWLPGLLVSIGLCVPYLFRGRFPLWVFLATSAACMTQVAVGEGALGANIMVVLALYNFATRYVVFVSVAGLLIASACYLVAFAPTVAGHVNFEIRSSLVFVLFLAWLIGVVVRVRRSYIESLREYARRLRQEKDNQARIIASEERARIAREIHDIVSHRLSIVVLMTDAAISKIDADPQLAQESLATARDTGRVAMTEMRRMVGVLRTTDTSPLDPQPGVDQLPSLIEATEATGVRVSFTVLGAPIEFSEGLDLCVYRIVQEGLTNARKHGGADLSWIEVRVSYSRDEVTVEVLDDGAGGAGQDRHDTGHGLVGVRERAALYGGSVEACDRPSGGFALTARMPIGDAR